MTLIAKSRQRPAGTGLGRGRWRAAWAWLVLALALPGLRAQSAGYIHVVCEPGVQVLLDRVSQGQTERRNDGLVIDGVKPGLRRLDLVKAGFEPQENWIQVDAGEVAEYRAAVFEPNGGPAKPTGTASDNDKAIVDLGIKLVWIKAGSFLMGSPADELGRRPNEGPQTQVRFKKGFWLDKTELTQGQYAEITTRVVTPSTPGSPLPAGRGGAVLGGRGLPVANVSWDDAMAFCLKLSERERAAGRLPTGYRYTLPTEAQWEYACRAGTTDSLAGNPDELVLSAVPRTGAVRQVAQKRPNDWGLFDTQDNLREWCLNWYEEKLPGGMIDEPHGPTQGDARVVRGGSFTSATIFCRPAARGYEDPSSRLPDVGFRIALVPPEW